MHFMIFIIVAIVILQRCGRFLLHAINLDERRANWRASERAGKRLSEWVAG